MRLQSKSALPISGLPSEILTRIASFLDATHPQSLVAFAQTSKRLYAVASKFLFSTLKFTPLTNGKSLAKDVETWERILLRDEALQHVRRLILYWDGENDGSIPDHRPYLSLKECECSDSDTDLETCWDLYYWEWCYETNSWIKDHEWEPLARLLKKLTGLADFFFANPGPFPPQFLQILHDRSSRCRLHHYTFRLGGSDMASLEADERSLIMSPCLSTIGNMNADRHCLLNKNQFAAMLLARREASSLRRVFAYWHGPKRQVLESQDAEDESILPDPPALEYLQIFGSYSKNYQHYYSPTEGSISASDIDYEVLYNYTALRVLKLNLPIGDQPLPAPSNLPSLVTFSVMCPDQLSSPEWSDSLLAFLWGLPSIKVLRVLGWPRSISFTPGLNKQLQKLHLETRPIPGGPPLLDDHVLQLAVMCPDIEDLTMETKRSRGDAAEVARYRALGRLPRLRRLKLILDAAPPPIIPDDIVEVPERGQGPWKPYYPWPGHTDIEPWFKDGWDSEEPSWYSGEVSWELKPHCNSHVRDVLVNSAIDSALALSIFGVVNSAKVCSIIYPEEDADRECGNGESFLIYPRKEKCSLISRMVLGCSLLNESRYWPTTMYPSRSCSLNAHTLCIMGQWQLD